MRRSMTHQILRSRLADGALDPGGSMAVKVDQVLTHDALGGLVFLQFAAMGIKRVQTKVAVAYADHNVFQVDPRMMRDHRLIRNAAAKFGAYFSRPGSGICHQVHLERFAAPGKLLLGSDSHTPTAGGIGMFAAGAGGLDVTMALAGAPWRAQAPRVIAVKLTGALRPWVTAKDVILELLRRLSVKGGVGRVFEFIGPGIAGLSVPQRATITNMCTELGATTGIFPSDEVTRDYLDRAGRVEDFQPLAAGAEESYAEVIEVDLDSVDSLVACPSMPDKVMTARELVDVQVDQVLVGSCTNGSYTDLRQVAELMTGRSVAPGVDLIINPSSRQALELLANDGFVGPLTAAGAIISEATCGPCIGQVHLPAPGAVSVRAFNRNFSGRSGLKDDRVYLASPLVAAVAAITGHLGDPAEWAGQQSGVTAPEAMLPQRYEFSDNDIIAPASEDKADAIELPVTPEMKAMPNLEPLPESLTVRVAGVFGDDITTDDISPASPEALASMTELPEMASYTFAGLDEGFVTRCKETEGAAIVAGDNYGQGSSRENSAMAPRHLGVRVVLARSFARIHRTNLVNWGVVPLLLESGRAEPGDEIELDGIKSQLISLGVPAPGDSTGPLELRNLTTGEGMVARHDLSRRDLLVVLSGGLLPFVTDQGGERQGREKEAART
ncbi:MAG: aconitate hydratase [Actinomycetota bacterium]